jgi:hypothetical protein
VSDYDAGDPVTLTLTVDPAAEDTTASVQWFRPNTTEYSPAPSATPNDDRTAWTAIGPTDDAGGWTALWTVTGTGAGNQSYEVEVSPLPPGPVGYADSGDYATWTQAAPPAGVARRLRQAGLVIDHWTRSAVYDTDDAEMPTDATIAAAMRDASCAQVEAWLTNGTDQTGPGAAGYTQVTAGRITLVRNLSGAGASLSSMGVVSGMQLAPMAASILSGAGLLGFLLAVLNLPVRLLHDVTVRAYRGRSGLGDVYAEPVTVLGLFQDERRRVRTSTGATVQAAGFVLLPLETDCPLGSKVTAPDGREFRAELVSRLDGGGLPTDHLDVTLI